MLAVCHEIRPVAAISTGTHVPVVVSPPTVGRLPVTPTEKRSVPPTCSASSLLAAALAPLVLFSRIPVKVTPPAFQACVKLQVVLTAIVPLASVLPQLVSVPSV